jgi:hypothetical protein
MDNIQITKKTKLATKPSDRVQISRAEPRKLAQFNQMTDQLPTLLNELQTLQLICGCGFVGVMFWQIVGVLLKK